MGFLNILEKSLMVVDKGLNVLDFIDTINGNKTHNNHNNKYKQIDKKYHYYTDSNGKLNGWKKCRICKTRFYGDRVSCDY